MITIDEEIAALRHDIQLRGTTADGYEKYFRNVHSSRMGVQYHTDDHNRLAWLIARKLSGQRFAWRKSPEDI